MPYMSERVELAEKALYLKSKGLSYEGIAHVLGKSEKHWYNVYQSLVVQGVSLGAIKFKQPKPSPDTSIERASP
jgi:hypothetical protein